MAEIVMNRPNWLGSEVGMVLKTTTVSETSGTPVTENGRKILKSGTLITDETLGQGLLYNDADVTDGAVVKSIMVGGYYINEKLPTSISGSAEALATKGLYAIKYSNTVMAYGEVTE